ncbi:hypothetical protein C8E00_105112 [Chromohalobacter marismortui]|uniref:Uncharacterized protein n=1 Tax=Chromohalobacter marismortui TaxID=42055 RepID=A0A4R7NLZ8_9GAMM|nr:MULTISPECIES: hypothetical protein [Chromohalobacter]MCI0510210.1 hypothetical protein [Chromohalobacter sp.]MCI0593386.1 hypothetical protein [Chromohalobacter sp.]TDU21628.1 hypothetical protein C8E00_105112 [Chromohalobacter marismortui]
MELFIQTALGFPFAFFLVLLALVALYWLLVGLRVLRVSCFDHDSLRDDHLASTLISLGFAGVPASFALSALIVTATPVAFVLSLILHWLPLGLLRLPLGFLAIWAAFALASSPSVVACHALARRFHHARRASPRWLLGETVVVRQASDSQGRCQATLESDPEVVVTLHGKGAGCLAGERRVLVKHVVAENAYRAVPAEEYLDAHVRLRKLHLLPRHDI